MGHFHGHSRPRPSGIVPPPGTWRGQALFGLQDFIRGRLASLFEAKGNQVKTLSFFPVWILGQWSTSQDHTTARTSRSSTLMSPSIGLGGASDFILGTPGLTLVVVTSLPDDDLLGSLALDPRTPGVSPQGQGTTVPA